MVYMMSKVASGKIDHGSVVVNPQAGASARLGDAKQSRLGLRKCPPILNNGTLGMCPTRPREVAASV